MSSSSQHQLPPVWSDPEDLKKGLSHAWLNEIVKQKDPTFGNVETMVGVSDAGGFTGELIRIRFQNGTLMFKQLIQAEKREACKLLGLSREAHFYNSTSIATHHLIDPIIPKIYYAYADEVTGERYLLMEDLGQDGVQFGFLCGPGNPNNWAKQRSGELDAISQRFIQTPEQLEQICQSAFQASASIHAVFWNDAKILDIPWLRSSSWWSSPPKPDGESQWTPSMKEAGEHWRVFRANPDPDPSIWDPKLIELVDASFAKSSYQSYMDFIASFPFTLVHGDFHPANLMWVPKTGQPLSDISQVKFLDWEMVGVGSGPQELGQFVISHLENGFRAKCEERLVRAYYTTLTTLNPSISSSLTFDACWNEYIQGGLGRWMWFIGWMSTSMPPIVMKFFNQQVLSFAMDHAITVDNVPQPRI